jgi:drug/metabolite transporter (DMT)-like permease
VSSLAAPIPLAFAAAILFGLAIVAAQLGLRTVPTLPGAAIANAAAAAAFALAAPWLWSDAGFAWSAAGIFMLVGLFFPATVTLLMLEGNRRLGASVTATVSGTTPLFVYIAAIALLGESLSAGGLAGTLVIVAGIATLAGGGRLTLSRAMLLPLGSALLRALAQIVVKIGLVLWPSAFAATLIAYITSTAVTGTIVGVRREPMPRSRALGWFAASGLMNGMALMAMYSAFRDGEVSVVGPITATAPLVTLLVQVAVLRAERCTVRVVAGALLTSLGVALILLR